jgi:CarD family transcriptional regulator
LAAATQHWIFPTYWGRDSAKQRRGCEVTHTHAGFANDRGAALRSRNGTVCAAIGFDPPERTIMAVKALSFDVGDYVVYPKHGVGRVIELQQSEIAGMALELYVLRFEKERMTLRVPTNKAESVGMRKLSSDKQMGEALQTLKGKPRVKRTMWSRRAQEYEAKINSGDLVSIAEVVRDLFRAEDQPEQSYSERQIFEAAISRLARELAAMEQVDEPTAAAKLTDILKASAAIYNKSPVVEIESDDE